MPENALNSECFFEALPASASFEHPHPLAIFAFVVPCFESQVVTAR